METKTHDFNEQLEWSEAAGDEPFWDAIYHKAFPSMLWHKLCSGDTAGQRRGVDRLIYLSNDRVLRIDEKKRAKEYGDILLEYISVDTTGAPGWIEKDLAIDYLAYAFMQSQRVYLFDWLMLRRAWILHKNTWIEKYKIPPAKNNGYNTLSVAVPTKELRNAVAMSREIRLGNSNG